MHIRRFTPEDTLPLWRLKTRTIREINCRDYAPDQIAVWAPESVNLGHWRQRVIEMNPFVVMIDGEYAGFADVQPDGYVDHFYCGSGFQGQGVGRMLMDRIVSEAHTLGCSQMHSNVSITARPFFEHFGFRVVRPQQVVVDGIELSNFVMEKTLNSL